MAALEFQFVRYSDLRLYFGIIKNPIISEPSEEVREAFSRSFFPGPNDKDFVSLSHDRKHSIAFFSIRDCNFAEGVVELLVATEEFVLWNNGR